MLGWQSSTPLPFASAGYLTHLGSAPSHFLIPASSLLLRHAQGGQTRPRSPGATTGCLRPKPGRGRLPAPLLPPTWAAGGRGHLTSPPGRSGAATNLAGPGPPRRAPQSPARPRRAPYSPTQPRPAPQSPVQPRSPGRRPPGAR